GLGGSGSIDEIVERVLKDSNLSEEQQSVLHGNGPQTELEYRLAWARTYLKGMGLLVNSQRAVWRLTEEGRSVEVFDIGPLHRAFQLKSRAARRARAAEIADSDGSDDTDAEESPDWRDVLLEAV